MSRHDTWHEHKFATPHEDTARQLEALKEQNRELSLQKKAIDLKLAKTEKSLLEARRLLQEQQNAAKENQANQTLRISKEIQVTLFVPIVARCPLLLELFCRGWGSAAVLGCAAGISRERESTAPGETAGVEGHMSGAKKAHRGAAEGDREASS